MLDTVQIAVLSTLACFALVFVAYVKSVLGKAAQEQQQQKGADSISRKSSVADGGNEDDNSNKGGKARKVSGAVDATEQHDWLLVKSPK